VADVFRLCRPQSPIIESPRASPRFASMINFWATLGLDLRNMAMSGCRLVPANICTFSDMTWLLIQTASGKACLLGFESSARPGVSLAAGRFGDSSLATSSRRRSPRFIPRRHSAVCPPRSTRCLHGLQHRPDSSFPHLVIRIEESHFRLGDAHH
jgi:hypothetical protein